MGSDTTRKPASGFYYGWVILLVSWMLMFFTAGLSQAFGIFLKPMTEDFGWDRSSFALAMTLVAARAYGLDVIDGVYNDFKDDAGFRAECEHGRTLGMDGKTLIHPAQVAPCNEVFSPTEDEVTWAHKIIKAFEQPENARKGVITVEGKMVERLHLVMAQRVAAIAGAINARSKTEEPWF